jgi:hypothetical protein
MNNSEFKEVSVKGYIIFGKFNFVFIFKHTKDEVQALNWTVCTENIIGIWKRRFPCLTMGLRTKLAKSIEIIRATGALHNLEVILSDPVPEDDDIRTTTRWLRCTVQQPDDYDDDVDIGRAEVDQPLSRYQELKVVLYVIVFWLSS